MYQSQSARDAQEMGFGSERYALDASRAPIRPSLARFYPAREDPTRTRAARRESRALRLARSLKYNPPTQELSR